MATPRKTTNKKTDKVIEAVTDLKPQTVIEEIGALQSKLQNTLAGLSAQISTKIEQMNNVDEAITVKQTELQDLYSIETEAISLDEMRNQCLQEDIDWQKKCDDRQLQWDDEVAQRAKRWQREEEEHVYDMTQKKKRAVEEYNVEVTTRRRAEAIRQEDFDKNWTAREQAIASQEKEMADLKTQVTGFEDKLKAEVAKAEAIVGNRFKKEHEHELAMLKKDIDSERLLNSTKVSALDDTINNLQTQILDLQKQLTEARTDAKDVTSAALRSASGRQAMQALQRVVDNPATAKSK